MIGSDIFHFQKIRAFIGYGALHAFRKFCLQLISIVLLATTTATADPFRILAFGDSLVHGYGLPLPDGFVPQMERWLSTNGYDVEVLNAGVSGDTTAGGLARIEWMLEPEIDAVIVALGGNDVLRAIDPDLARENLRGILQVLEDRGMPILLVGINVPPNYGPEYQANFSGIYPDLAQEFGTIYYPDFLMSLMSRPDRAATLQEYFQADGLHPNAAGVAIIVNDLGPYVARLIDAR